MAPNLLIQCLEDFGDSLEFERLCNDIMRRHYRGYVPLGGMHDRGLDGLCILKPEEDRVFIKRHERHQHVIAFQHSLQKDWETKVKDTLSKLQRYGIEYDQLILVTNQKVSHDKRSNLQVWVSQQYNTMIEVHDQEFIRSYLESPELKHLTTKYFAQYLAQLRSFGIETSIFANLSIAERQKRRALVLLSACVRSQEGKRVRESAATEVLLGCLYGDGQKGICSHKTIRDELNGTFGSRRCLSDGLISETIDDLIQSGRVLPVDGGFCLSDDEWERIDGKIVQAYKEDLEFYRGLLEQIKHDYELIPDQESEVKLTIAKSIGNVFEQTGLSIAHALSGVTERDIGPMTSYNYPNISLIVRDAVLTLHPVELRAAVERVLRELFTEPTDFQAQYLFGIAESYLVHQCFNLDPHGRLLELESARRNILFIDTDIIVQVFVALPLGQHYRDMLRATRNLRIEMYTFPQMVSEFVYKVNKSHNDYIYMGRPPSVPREYIEELGDLFEAFFTVYKPRGLSWDQFITKLVGSSNDKDEQEQFVRSRLEAEYNIYVRDLLIENPAEMHSFADQITERRIKTETYKHDDLYETDATMALLIEQLQSEEQKSRYYWLLSSDSVLSREWQERLGKRPPVFPPQSWFQYISQHPASDILPTDFSKLMRSITVSPARPRIPYTLLITLIRVGFEIDQYKDETLEQLSEQLYQDWLWKEIIDQKPPKITDKKIGELQRGLSRVMARIEEALGPEQSELKSQVEQLTDREKELKEQLQELQEEKRQVEQKVEYYEKKDRSRKRYERQREKLEPKIPKRKKRH